MGPRNLRFIKATQESHASCHLAITHLSSDISAHLRPAVPPTKKCLLFPEILQTFNPFLLACVHSRAGMPFSVHPLSTPFPCWRICCLSSQSQLKNHTSPVKCLPPLSQGKAGFAPQGLCGTCFCYSAHFTVFSPPSPLNYKHLQHQTCVLFLSEKPTHPNAKIWHFAGCRHLLHTALGWIWVRKAVISRGRGLIRCNLWPDSTWEFRIQILVTPPSGSNL